jgi:uncharacterized membrane protein
VEAYVVDWLSFLGRAFHLIAGIAWIGASFYFIWLDSHLRTPRYADEAQRSASAARCGRCTAAASTRAEVRDRAARAARDAALVQVGGVLDVAVGRLPARTRLLPRRRGLPDRPDGRRPVEAAAIAIGIAFLAGGWLVYDLMCRSPLGRNEPWLAAAMLALCTLAAYALTHLYSGRGAFIHFGAMLGTIMAANVLMVIMPGQREMVKAKAQDRVPDPKYAARGKQRSVHNTYFTLPVLFTMISNHYAAFTNARHAWLVLIAISLAGVFVRLFFTFRPPRRREAVVLGDRDRAARGGLRRAAPATAPTAAAPPSFAQVRAIVASVARSAKPTRRRSRLRVRAEERRARHARAHRRAGAADPRQTVVTKAMPIGNLTAMTDAERAAIDAWYRAGAKADLTVQP